MTLHEKELRAVYTDTLRLALGAGVKQLGLFHLNQERTDAEMDRIVKKCRQRVAGENSQLKCFGVKSDMTFEL